MIIYAMVWPVCVIPHRPPVPCHASASAPETSKKGWISNLDLPWGTCATPLNFAHFLRPLSPPITLPYRCPLRVPLIATGPSSYQQEINTPFKLHHTCEAPRPL